MTATHIARRLRIKPQTVREVLHVLCDKMELVRVPNSNPMVFTDPHARPIKELDRNGPIDVFDGSEPIQDYLPEGAELPPGFVNVHISGYVSGTVRRKGRFENIFRDGKPIGVWTGPQNGGKGQTKWVFKIKLFGQVLSFVYWESNHGVMQARFYLKRIYVNPKKVSKARRREYFMERGEYFAKVLRLLDWQITDLQIKGRFHYGKENDPLSVFIPRDQSGGDIIKDDSPGVVETEMENLDDLPEDMGERMLQDYSNLPSAIEEVRESVNANSRDIGSLFASNRQQQALLSEIQETVNMQSVLISSLTENITKLTQASVQLTTLKISDVQNDTRSAISGRLEGYQ